MSETKNDLLLDLELDNYFDSAPLESLAATDSRYLRDLRMNLKAVLKSDHLSAKETSLIALAIAVNATNKTLTDSFISMSRKNEATEEEISEAMACASLLSANNVLYRYRHFVGKEEYNSAPARLRMNIMMSPVLGKEFFELLSLAVSAANGCEMCVRSHEQSVIHAGSTTQRIWDTVRLVSVIVSLSKVII